MHPEVTGIEPDLPDLRHAAGRRRRRVVLRLPDAPRSDGGRAVDLPGVRDEARAVRHRTGRPAEAAESHDHGSGDGLEWEDLMPEINRASDPGNMIWQLVDRQTGAVNGAIDWAFTVGDRVKIRLVNEMDQDHPMHHPFHIHGAGRFLVLSRDGAPEPNLVWKDTVLVRAGQTIDILLDVSNPGLWMAHCHIAEHAESGMMFSFNVARRRSRSDEPRAPTAAPLDVLVIGGGQAGLAMGYQLAQRGLRFEIVDAGPEIGHVWRSRWDSLRLFTSGRYDNLPGLPFPAAAGQLPRQGRRRGLPDGLRGPVRPAGPPGHHRDVAGPRRRRLPGQGRPDALEAGQVVVATGAFQLPFTPPVAAELAPTCTSCTAPTTDVPRAAAGSGAGRRGGQLRLPDRSGAVGDPDGGPRGRPRIPDDAAAAAGTRRVVVGHGRATGPGHRRLPAGPAAGRARPDRRPRPHAARPPARHPVRPRVTTATGRSVTFADGTDVEYDAVVWATGFSTDDSWVDVPDATDERGRLRQVRGVTPSPGLYTLGRIWQHTRGSALLGWVGRTRPSSPSRSRHAPDEPPRPCTDAHAARDEVDAPPSKRPRRACAPGDLGRRLGVLQAASPLAFFWLSRTVYACGRGDRCGLHRVRVADGRRRSSPSRPASLGVRRGRRGGGDGVGLAARGGPGRLTASRTSGSTAPDSSPTPGGGRRSAPPSTASPPPYQPPQYHWSRLQLT